MYMTNREVFRNLLDACIASISLCFTWTDLVWGEPLFDMPALVHMLYATLLIVGIIYSALRIAKAAYQPLDSIPQDEPTTQVVTPPRGDIITFK
jgi:hypothetical protein